MKERKLIKEYKLGVTSQSASVHGASNSLTLPINDFRKGVVNVFLFSLPQEVDSLSVDRIRLSTFFTEGYQKFRFGIINKQGKAVVLIDTVGGETSLYSREKTTYVNAGNETFMGAMLRSLAGSYHSQLTDEHLEVDVPLGYFKISKDDKFFFEFDVISLYTNYSNPENTNITFVLPTALDLSKKPHYLLNKVFFNTVPSEIMLPSNFQLQREEFDHIISYTPLLVNNVPTTPNIYRLVEAPEVFRPLEILNSDCVFDRRGVIVGFPDTNSQKSTFRTVKKVYNQDTFSFLQENLIAAREIYFEVFRKDFIQSAYKMILGELPKSDELNRVIENLSQIELNEKNRGHYDPWEMPEVFEEVLKQ